MYRAPESFLSMMVFSNRPLIKLSILVQLPFSTLAQYIPQYAFANNNGAIETLWSATVGAPITTVTGLPVLPTLVYNCENVPALCQNVINVLGRHNVNPNAIGEFGWDPEETRKKTRRRNRCPKAWSDPYTPAGQTQQRDRCPEDDQPEVKPANYARPGPEVDPDSLHIAGIPDANGDETWSGMMMTCDEFPPAMSIQGGVGTANIPSLADTYCTPMNYKCSPNFRGPGVGINSEQDWQRNLHGYLAGHVSTDSNHIWKYNFRIVRVAGSTAAGWVTHMSGNAVNHWELTANAKRDLEDPSEEVVYAFGIDDTHRHYRVPKGSTPEDIVLLHDLAPRHTKNLRYKPNTIGDLRRRGNGTFVQSEEMPSNQTRTIVHQNLKIAPPLPILAIGEEYIRGSIGANATLAGNLSHAKDVEESQQTIKPRRAGFTKYLPLNKRAVEGPIQCGPGKPCADGSCCNSDGKCGFKAYNCKPAGPVKCLSNCDATAMCGVDSAGGKLKCGLNLCCSYYGWCGTQDVHCINSDPQGKTAPCQAGYGGCTIVPSPSCGTGSGTASGGRKIGYYQSWNTRQRNCNRVSPNQIKKDGLTHLNYAFANIDPTSFAVVPASSIDEKLYLEFTALQSSTLKTWISIGGFDFSDIGPTRTTWSDMASTQANRAKFISSLVQFMDKYHFQGVDLDWEYPASLERGGRPQDTANLVSLVKEMRAAFGTKYGLSSILAPDYWYLRGMDPKGMEPYMDWFNFMAYDLHGSWDADVKTLGSIIRAQTDLREINNDTVPLWFDKLTPAKVNLGIAYYGRGYTVSDPKCAYPGCGFSGPSKKAPCTGFDGVMSNREIEQLIKAKGLYPELLKDPAIKMISWDDQWIGYDDAETIAMKTAFANDRCMGGTMIWSVDFDSGAGSGDNPDGGGGPGPDSGGNGGGSGLVYIDPSIWDNKPNPQVQCEPPCIYVFPPIPLNSLTTISLAPLTTSFAVQTTVTEKGGSVHSTVTTQKTTITLPAVTTSEINVYAVTIFSKDTTTASFTVVPSILPPSIVVTLPGSDAAFPVKTPGPTTSSSLPPIVFFPSAHSITIQPQPTVKPSLTKNPPSVTHHTGKPSPTCTDHCGKHSCVKDGCAGGCALWGCGGTCGLFGCGGTCGLWRCGGEIGPWGGKGGCGVGGCGPSNCPDCGGGENEDDDDEDDDDDDDEKGETCALDHDSDDQPFDTSFENPIQSHDVPQIQGVGENHDGTYVIGGDGKPSVTTTKLPPKPAPTCDGNDVESLRKCTFDNCKPDATGLSCIFGKCGCTGPGLPTCDKNDPPSLVACLNCEDKFGATQKKKCNDDGSCDCELDQPNTNFPTAEPGPVTPWPCDDGNEAGPKSGADCVCGATRNDGDEVLDNIKANIDPDGYYCVPWASDGKTVGRTFDFMGFYVIPETCSGGSDPDADDCSSLIQGRTMLDAFQSMFDKCFHDDQKPAALSDGTYWYGMGDSQNCF